MPVRMAIIKKSTNTKIRPGYEEKGTLESIGGTVNWNSH